MYLIIDISWLYCLYYYVNKDKGYLDGAIYGITYFLSLLYRNMKDIKHVYFVLDGDSQLYVKNKLFKEYKQGRSDKTDVYKNMSDFLKIVSTFPKSTIIQNKYKEADETISFLALNHARKGKVLIYSGDKDHIQLLGCNENIFIADKYKQGSFIEWTTQEVWEKFKNSKKEDFTRISTNKKDLLKYRILSGDASDNIPPPIKGLTDKNKKVIIQAWLHDELTPDILANIIINVKDEKLKHQLASGFDNILLNYKLMDLTHCDKDYWLQKETKKIRPETTKEIIIELCKKYKLQSYVDRIINGTI